MADWTLEIVGTLSSAAFVSSGRHHRRVWLSMTILGVENQRDPSYTLRDIREFGRIEIRNRTLAV